DLYASVPVTVLEGEPRPGTILRFRGLRAEAVADVAAHGLHVEVGRRRSRESQLQIPAHRLTFEPSVRGQGKAGGQVARNALEAAARDRLEIQRHVAADGADLNFAAAAGN